MLQYKAYFNNIVSKVKNLIAFCNNQQARWRKYHFIKTPDGQIITDPAGKTKVLKQYFKTVFTIEDNINLPDKSQLLYPTIANFEITTQDVYNILNTCKPHKSLGPDGMHPHALRVTAAEVSPMLTHIFQQSLSTGTLYTYLVETCLCYTYF